METHLWSVGMLEVTGVAPNNTTRVTKTTPVTKTEKSRQCLKLHIYTYTLYISIIHSMYVQYLSKTNKYMSGLNTTSTICVIKKSQTQC